MKLLWPMAREDRAKSEIEANIEVKKHRVREMPTNCQRSKMPKTGNVVVTWQCID